jgi:transcriptional regulator with XRE-family HTH domain
MNRPREDWARLGSYVVSARIAAGYRDRRAFAAATGVTDRTLGKLENGQRVSADTVAAVELKVGWKPDSGRMILAGGEPTPVRPPEDDRREAARRAEEFLANLSEEEMREIAERFVEVVRSRAAAHDEREASNGA